MYPNPDSFLEENGRLRARVAELEQGRTLLPYCPRCCRIAPAEIHTCTPTPEWRAMEARVAELEKENVYLRIKIAQQDAENEALKETVQHVHDACFNALRG